LTIAKELAASKRNCQGKKKIVDSDKLMLYWMFHSDKKTKQIYVVLREQTHNKKGKSTEDGS
jgi:hypothetical protein